MRAIELGGKSMQGKGKILALRRGLGFIYSPVAQPYLQDSCLLDGMSQRNLILLILSTPVMVIVGRPFYVAGTVGE